MKRTLLRNTFLVLAACGVVTAPTAAIAHQVQTNYLLNGQSDSSFGRFSENQADGQPVDRLELQSTFGNGQPLKGATVSVYSPDQPNRVWAKGLTDNQGRYTFEPDESISGEWEVTIERDGHKDIITVPVSEAGINADLMAQGSEIKDVHYASSPWMAVGSVAIAAAAIGVARYGMKKTAE